MRKPLEILGTEVDDEYLIVKENGEIRYDTRIFINHEDMGAMRAGYYCAKCFEPQEKPFPEKCGVCKFPMRDKQSEFIAKGYRGDIRVGPGSSASDEQAYMEEYAERERFKAKGVTPQIWTPGDSI